MSLITQCPACATMFRVVPDQLRISEGWVRCGQCDEVFDGNAHLLQQEALATPPEGSAPVPAPLLAHGALPEPRQEVANPVADAYDWGPLVPDEDPLAPVATAGAAVAAPNLVFAQDPPSPVFAENPLDESAPLDVADEPAYRAEADPLLHVSPNEPSVAEDALAMQYTAALLEREQESTSDAAASEVTERHEPSPSAQAEESPLSFMPPVRKASRMWQWLGTPVLGCLCGVLLVTLALQLAVQERNRLAAMQPDLRPALEALCEVLACRIAAPQHIEAIAIDSSAFTSIRPGIYTLAVTLKSTASLPLQSPALELTLTDRQDKPLFRRVVRAEEYASKQEVIAAGAELSASVPVSVHAADALEHIAGYKLLAFYP